MTHSLRITLILLGLFGASQLTLAKDELKSETEKVGYSIGIDFANNLKRQGIDIDIDALVLGIQHASKGKKLLLTPEQMQQAKTSFQQKMMAKRQAEMSKVAEANKKQGDAFLAANKKKSGVKTTDSGLQYKVLKSGKGASPKATDTVKTHYRGTLIDGTEFDSSYSRGQPATFPVNGVIQGWQEALQKMKVGDKWQLFVPSSLGYGERGAGATIGPNATLIFEIELLEVEGS